MISYLQGTTGGMEDDGAMTIIANGVGYRVLVGDRDRDTLNKRGFGGDVVIYCRTTASENEIVVYGFLHGDDRRAFDRVTKLNGIGPVTALRLLSMLDAASLKKAVDSGNVAAICKVPGIGKKTAEKVVAELKL